MAVTNALATAYSNQKKGVTLSTGRLVVVVGNTTTNAQFIWADDGQTWTDYGADIAGWSNGSISSYVDSGGVERLVAVWKQSGTGGGRTDGYTYAMSGAFNAGRTTLTWGTALARITDTTYNYPDIVVTPEGTGGVAWFAESSNNGASNNSADLFRVDISSSGVCTAGVNVASATYGVAVHTFPSIDINLTDKRLHVAWSAGTTGAGKGIRYRTASYSGGVWTWATEREITPTYAVLDGDHWVNCRWDGTRVIIGGLLGTGANWTLHLFERDAADTTTTTRFTGTALADPGQAYKGTLAVDTATGDVYFMGLGYAAGYTGVGYLKWTRATTTLGAKVITDATWASHVNAWFSNSTLRWIYTGGNNSPYQVKYDQNVLNVAPTAATWLTASGAYDVAATLGLDWLFVDPNPSDTMSAYALKRDIGGTITHWRASDSTWQVAEIKNLSATDLVTLPIGWGNDSDPNHIYYVKTWDAADTAGVYSGGLTITPSAKVNPVIDEPDPADVIGTSSLTVDWTVAAQSQYLLELLDNAGTTVLATTGWTANSGTRTAVVAYTLANSTSYKVRLTTKNLEGLTSNAVTHSFSVSYTPPATATLVVSSASGIKNVVTITNPAPGGGQPAVTENRLHRRKVGAAGAGTRVAVGVANNGSYSDVYVGHLEQYEYRAEVIGANGTTSFSAWTP